MVKYGALALSLMFFISYTPATAALTTSKTITVTYPNALATLGSVNPSADYPVGLIIPSIGLATTVVGVGVDNKGNMDVPSGSTQNVGWYKQGTKPGDIGSAVLDAHVFAAFKNLKYVPAGADVYVLTAYGKTLHFRVSNIGNYKLSELTGKQLFGLNDTARLNLITCSGSLTPDHSTYDHRLVVYATLVS